VFEKKLFTAEPQRTQRDFLKQSRERRDCLNQLWPPANTLPKVTKAFSFLASQQKGKNISSLRPLRLCGETFFQKA
jgi:hypothetical protein